mmetsp:Transcript_11554/g.20464  ORF Transcript_11554/g.20464 Transcript_11554/m.20464 type:complete len:128 (+) Transcript_11554:1011-1394(+)|eukprot:CAMPEP_0197708392 /NCGR_PEP_ID=MMETSP1338-20131121/127932_1 /TAXON_ID=43686 ORGANISM="Pelagodinium beii, Strain RCC1491" /NCGR_SAMPLE_ID=MMETSP1338 /ASSEMBLY_ACC=CAM_ASM_000754 /LENGTH=127 /DNA_ID=CAMNT_0043292323 /DNA_START=1007 /DNA_END=1390 /DNA_ORIENTATION=+
MAYLCCFLTDGQSCLVPTKVVAENPSFYWQEPAVTSKTSTCVMSLNAISALLMSPPRSKFGDSLLCCLPEKILQRANDGGTFAASAAASRDLPGLEDPPDPPGAMRADEGFGCKCPAADSSQCKAHL